MGVKVNSEKMQENLSNLKKEKYKVKQEMFDKQKVKKGKGKLPNKNVKNNQKRVDNDTFGETWRPFAYLLKNENDKK